MSKAEIEVINEIQQYKHQLSQTQSKQRQHQLWNHIRKLERELKIYRQLRYGKISY